jgi:SAM-dependent methyltransferase
MKRNNLNYKFPKFDFFLRQKIGFKRYGIKYLYKQFRPNIVRSFSKDLVKKYTNNGIGLEIGVGGSSIAPLNRTVLSDAYCNHTTSVSIAKEFFRADCIPYDDNTFDFVLAEHVIEHLTNPIKTLIELKRVLKKNGILILFNPNKNKTFDIYREVTKPDHLIKDYEKNISEFDNTHLEEFKKNVFSNDLASHYKNFSDEEILNNGYIHHHVFTPSSLTEILTYISFEVIYSLDEVPDRNDSFLVIGKKQ